MLQSDPASVHPCSSLVPENHVLHDYPYPVNHSVFVVWSLRSKHHGAGLFSCYFVANLFCYLFLRNIIRKGHSLTSYYSDPGRGAVYCNQFLFVCLCVCLSVCEHIPGTAGLIFTIFCADPLWSWLSPPLPALWYVMYFWATMIVWRTRGDYRTVRAVLEAIIAFSAMHT